MTEFGKLKSPVLFLAFNRPAETARVFEAIRQARPGVLMVVADGPRADRAGEAEKCAEVRRLATAVDWPCELITEFSQGNMGCRNRVSSGITLAMERFERAIILEDDCLPHPTFFPYCDELLERYAEDPRIFSVTGHNFLRGRRRRNDDSYYFSRYTQMWGWATWRRAWKHYDVKAGIWPEVRDGGWLRELLTDPRDLAYWSHMFQGVYDGYDTWDYQWFLAAWANNALAIMPSVNLITNIGFGAEATHTISRDVEVADMPAEAMAFPLKHPRIVMRDVSADEQMKRIAHSLPTTWMKIQRRLRRILGRRNK